MNKEIIVSVGFCVWNEEEVVLELLQNADKDLKRDFDENFEVIVVDNCSTDSTFKIVSKFIENNPNFSVIKHDYNQLYSGSNNSIFPKQSSSIQLLHECHFYL